jgi:hypothetical protein
VRDVIRRDFPGAVMSDMQMTQLAIGTIRTLSIDAMQAAKDVLRRAVA